MNFASLYIADFPVQAVMRGEPDLNQRAVALVEPEPPPFRVFALNEAARRAGAEYGMSRVEVTIIPGLEVRQRSPAAEASAQAALFDLARSFTPRFEHVAADTVVLDLAGLEALLGPPPKIARRLASQARELGLQAHVAFAANPDTARIAARGFAGITLIAEGEEAEELGKLPVETLDLSPEMQETLARWGIRTFRALAALPAPELSERLGQEGIRLQTLARGGSLRALVPAEDPLYFEEALDLEHPVAELEPLAFILGRLLNQLCGRLSMRGRATLELRLVLDLESGHEDRQLGGQNSKPETRNPKLKLGKSKLEIRNSKSDGALSSAIGNRPSAIENRALRLPVPTRDSRLLLKLWMLELEAHPPSAPVLKLAITAEPTRPRVAQGDLFLPRVPDPQKLELTLARLRGVVGEGKAGSPELQDTHRPDAFRMVPFGEAKHEIRNSKLETQESKVKTRTSKREIRNSEFAIGNSRTRPPKPDSHESRVSSPEFRVSNFEFRNPLRRFRPPLEASVEIENGRPVRVESRRVRGRIVSAAGPWRTSGGWWTDNPWEHDEWEIEVIQSRVVSHRSSVLSSQLSIVSHQFSAISSSPFTPRIENQNSTIERERLYRVFCDLRNGKWFVSGLYD